MPEWNGNGKAVMLFGPPGSGKGTQAKLVQECLHVPHISTGDMLRARMQTSDELGETIRRLLDQGELVTDDLVNQMVAERVVQPDCLDGFLLDGYPRTLSQADWVCGQLEARGTGWVVIHLLVDYNEIIARLAGRRHCAGCGAVYHIVFRPPQVEGVCDSCRGALRVREDDRESVIRRRLDAYAAQSKPLLEYFAGQSAPFLEVDGVGATPAAIATQICEFIRAGQQKYMSMPQVAGN